MVKRRVLAHAFVSYPLLTWLCCLWHNVSDMTECYSLRVVVILDYFACVHGRWNLPQAMSTTEASVADVKVSLKLKCPVDLSGDCICFSTEQELHRLRICPYVNFAGRLYICEVLLLESMLTMIYVPLFWWLLGCCWKVQQNCQPKQTQEMNRRVCVWLGAQTNVRIPRCVA